MFSMIAWIVAASLIWVCLYYRFPLWLSTGLSALATASVAWMNYALFNGELAFLFLFGLALSVVLFLLCMPWLRTLWITSRLLPFFKQKLPRISQTEREVLESGDTSWDAELFSGSPDWQALYAIPAPQLSPEEEAFLKGPVAALCDLIDDYQVVQQSKTLSPEIWAHIKEHRFFAMGIPKEYGGLEFSPYAHSCVVATIASRSTSTAVTVMVPNSLGPGELLRHYGTAEQRNYYLPRLASGLDIPCFGLTELHAGSDAGGIQAEGVVTRAEWKGQTVLGIRLNFEKRYITLAPVATLFGVAFKLFDPEEILSSKREIGITLALIERGTSGLTADMAHLPLGAVFPNGRLSGRDVFIPLDAVIGGKERVGHGWRMLMSCLGEGRGISLPALSAAASQTAFRTTLYYSALRKQFSLPINQFEGIQTILARMAGLTYLVESTRKLTLAILGQGKKPAVITAITKYHLTEITREVLSHGMDVQAGKAIMLGNSNAIAHLFMSFPIAITVEGANILTRNLIVFGQGVIRCHPYVFTAFQALEQLQDPDRLSQRSGLVLLDHTLFKHVGYTLSNLTRMVSAGFSSVLWPNSFTQPLKNDEAKFERASAVLTVMSDVALLCFGGALKRHERLSASLGDMLSALYLGSAVLLDIHQKKITHPTPVMRWALDEALFRFWSAFDQVIHYFPMPKWGRLLDWLARPLRDRTSRPSQSVEQGLIKHLLQDPRAFEALTPMVYGPENAKDPVGQFAHAWQALQQVSPVLLKKQKKEALSLEEEAKLKQFDALLSHVLSVDEFPYRGVQPHDSNPSSFPPGTHYSPEEIVI